MAGALTLGDIVLRKTPPTPWAEGDNIPWDDLAFSGRMLAEHLSQAHDLASRRAAKIDAQVTWIHTKVLGGAPARILDLACGPGLYTSRLARLGHTCFGIDLSPAALAYAREQAADLACDYVLDDLRRADFGGPYDLAMLLYGQFNVFRPGEAYDILRRACESLRPGGTLLLEPHTYAGVREMVNATGEERGWSTHAQGLFADRPHLLLAESFWDQEQAVVTGRYYVVDAVSAGVTRYAISTKAYTLEQYAEMIEHAGLVDPAFYPSLLGEPDAEQPALLAITARRAERRQQYTGDDDA